jgi:hypothetical protein
MMRLHLRSLMFGFRFLFLLRGSPRLCFRSSFLLRGSPRSHFHAPLPQRHTRLLPPPQ